MNAETNEGVYRLTNGRMFWMAKYCPKRWFHWHVSTVVFLCIGFFFAGVLTWMACVNLFVPITTCDYPHTLQELRTLK